MSKQPIQISHILSKLDLIHVEKTIWAGRTKLRPEDIGVDAGQLPPEAIASLGSKKIFNPSRLKVFHTISKRAERALSKRGVRILGGYGIAESEAVEVAQELDQLVDEFNQAKTQFEKDYDKALEEWLADFPEWESILRRHAKSKEVALSRLFMSWVSFKLAPASDTDGDPLNNGLGQMVNGIGDCVLEEIAQEAKASWTDSFKGKQIVGQKALRPLRRMLKKLRNLGFTDQRVRQIAKDVESLLKSLPGTGDLGPKDTRAASSILLGLMQPELILEHGQAILDQITPEQAMFDFEGPVTELEEETDADKASVETAAPETAAHEAEEVLTPPAEEVLPQTAEAAQSNSDQVEEEIPVVEGILILDEEDSAEVLTESSTAPVAADEEEMILGGFEGVDEMPGEDVFVEPEEDLFLLTEQVEEGEALPPGLTAQTPERSQGWDFF